MLFKYFIIREVGSPRRDSMALERSGARSPTAELERAVRDQLHYSHTLDEDIMDQVTNGERCSTSHYKFDVTIPPTKSNIFYFTILKIQITRGRRD